MKEGGVDILWYHGSNIERTISIALMVDVSGKFNYFGKFVISGFSNGPTLAGLTCSSGRYAF